MNDKPLPTSLVAAVLYFSDLAVCRDYMRRLKWPDGKIVCPTCGNDSCHELKSRPNTLKCNKASCQKQFSYKVGTIFEDSPLGLNKWFVAVWCIANDKNGISSHELARALGVTQKSAWFMLHRIREAMKTNSFTKMSGPVESDETYIGGEAKNMHEHIREKKIKGRGAVGKTPVQGIIERGGEVRTFMVPKADADTLQTNIYRNVERGSQVFTDAATAYMSLSRDFIHETVDHIKTYVSGRIHTNSIENFWSLFKRCIHGTWTHIAPFHVDRYADEEAWRFNHRRTGDGTRFSDLMAGVLGKRITYRRLCMIDDAGFMGLQ